MISLLLLTLAGATGAQPAAAEPLFRFTPDSGFVDDAMAFDSTDSQFAYVHTDSAKFLRVRLVDVHGFRQRHQVELPDPQRVPQQLVFTPDGRGLLVVWMDGRTGKHGVTIISTATGEIGRQISGYDNAYVATWGGAQVVSAAKATVSRGGQRMRLQMFEPHKLKQTKRADVSLGADGRLKRPPIRLLYWAPGRMSLVGTSRGAYDKKRDIRLPDDVVRYDPFTRKATSGGPPKEIVEWTRAINMRPAHPLQSRFLQVSPDLKRLLYVDPENRISTLSTPVKWGLYEPKSLVQHETWDMKTLYFSMTIDPVNREAVARKKADRERCDIYRLAAGPKAIPVGQVLTKKREFAWHPGQRHFAYLRKLKGFGRGGKTLEVYATGATAKSRR